MMYILLVSWFLRCLCLRDEFVDTNQNAMLRSNSWKSHWCLSDGQRSRALQGDPKTAQHERDEPKIDMCPNPSKLDLKTIPNPTKNAPKSRSGGDCASNHLLGRFCPAFWSVLGAFPRNSRWKTVQNSTKTRAKIIQKSNKNRPIIIPGGRLGAAWDRLGASWGLGPRL